MMISWQKGKPLVSIVTPSFNQVEYLEETISSVLAQNYPHIEYIVVDGGSTDGSVDIIRAYSSRLARWVSEADMGQTDAINKGFAMATGDILAWLNSDDTYLPGAVSKAVDYLISNPHIGMVYGKAYYIDEDSEPVALYPAGQTNYSGLRRGKTTIPQQTMFFRNTLWDMVGPLDSSFYYAMDYDLWTRISAVSPIGFHKEFMANFRLHSASKSLTEANRCWPEMMRVHFRDGGSRYSVFYLKYLIRRVVEPVMPLRLKYRRVVYKLARKS
jgi:glycosyltransferase involved in cell wall biosynthesis